ncbi:MAG: hypothetical protein K2G34_08615, partial [Bacteroides sp.]|nr:hypothetical protein [Bacteroides sp.]
TNSAVISGSLICKLPMFSFKTPLVFIQNTACFHSKHRLFSFKTPLVFTQNTKAFCHKYKLDRLVFYTYKEPL